MQRTLFGAAVLLVAAIATPQAAPRDVDIKAPDGARLRATFYAAGKSGPAVILLHMCNTTRKSWASVAEQLSAAGINALTLDYRGFGESDGAVANPTPEQIQQVQAKWPADLDAAYAWLLAQPGVDKARVGTGGGSCGVNNAVKLASRHPEVSTLVLLAGGADAQGLHYLLENAWLALFTAAADDDEYDAHAPQLMQWYAELGGNPRNKFVHFKDGRHGTEIFGPHPELPQQIVAFYADTLVKSPAQRNAKFTPKNTPLREFWRLTTEAGGAERAAQYFRQARQRDPQAFLFPEQAVNLLGYEHLQAGRAQDAITFFKLNAEAYPASANAQDSLADGYLATGQTEQALAAEQKCLELLPNDTAPEAFKTQIKQVAEQKIAKLKSSQAK
jgi:dienelactone hydrolase